MTESTLSLSLTELQQEVGSYLGYGYGPAKGDVEWTEAQQAAIDKVIRAGLRQFYFPPILPNEETAHDWSFLRPVASLTLESGESTLALPDDFGGAEGEIVVTSTSGGLGRIIPYTSVPLVLARHQTSPTATGWPMMAAIEALKGTSQGKGQRSQLRIYPQADAAYTLQVTYYLLPDALTTSRPFPYGGAQHAETIKYSCLAKAEQELDNELGVNSTLFLQHLAASVSQDRKSKPQVIGYNGDGSDRERPRHRTIGLATVNGILWD